jgi:glycosyltransferase involved in cell wall biosynthesis
VTAKKPQVSVVVPTYNRGGFIRETIESVLMQTYADFEVIVVDDGSTDGTAEIISTIVDDRIHYHWQENSGLPARARNVALSAARGRYVAFLDSDDLWLPEKLESQIRCFAAHPDAGLVYCDAMYFGQTASHGRSLIRGMLEGNIFDGLLVRNRIPALTAVVRRECLDSVGQFSEEPALRSAEDYHLWLRIARRFPVYAVRAVLGRYRVHDRNLTAEVGPYRAAVRAVEEVGREFELPRRVVRRAAAAHYAELAWSRYKAADWPGFEDAYRMAMRQSFYAPLVLFRLCHRMLGPKWTMRAVERAGYN